MAAEPMKPGALAAIRDDLGREASREWAQARGTLDPLPSGLERLAGALDRLAVAHGVLEPEQVG